MKLGRINKPPLAQQEHLFVFIALMQRVRKNSWVKGFKLPYLLATISFWFEPCALIHVLGQQLSQFPKQQYKGDLLNVKKKHF